MTSNALRFLIVLSIGINSATAEELGSISEVGTGRIESNVARYIKTFDTSCLEIQIINPQKNWQIISSSTFCSFEGKNFDSEFADAGFENIHIKRNGIYMTLSITPLQPTGEQRKECVIPISDKEIKALDCSDSNTKL